MRFWICYFLALYVFWYSISSLSFFITLDIFNGLLLYARLHFRLWFSSLLHCMLALLVLHFLSLRHWCCTLLYYIYYCTSIFSRFWMPSFSRISCVFGFVLWLHFWTLNYLSVHICLLCLSCPYGFQLYAHWYLAYIHFTALVHVSTVSVYILSLCHHCRSFISLLSHIFRIDYCLLSGIAPHISLFISFWVLWVHSPM